MTSMKWRRMSKTWLLIAERCESKLQHKRLESMICCVELQDRTRSLKICESRLKSMTIFDLFWLLRLRVLWLFLQCIRKIRMSLLQSKCALLWCCLHSCLLRSLISLCFHSRLIWFCWWLLLSLHLQRWSCNLSLKRWRMQWALIWASYFIHSVNMIACAYFVLSD